MKRSFLLAIFLTAGLALCVSTTAYADEIVVADPDTCGESTISVHEIVSETWTEVKYREKAGPSVVSVPSALVVAVRRDTKSARAQVRDIVSAIGELRRGNVAEARRQLKVLSGGGFKQDLETGKLVYQSFQANDPPGRRKRAPWHDEYAHFFYAKALCLEGLAKKDKELLLHAHYALVDQKVPGGDGKTTTGGFLKRFDGGNSRWYPEAMLLTARALVGLEKWADAAKAYKVLGDEAISYDIGPRWAYEAKLGAGVIADARGKYLDAVNAYVDAANFMKILIRKETRGCFRRQIGRFYSRARMQAAGVMLRRAEKNNSPAEFETLRKFIDESTPEALRNANRTLPKPQREALIEGALDPEVQAVMKNGLGLAYLHEGKFEDAILAFRAVEVKYFQVPEAHARALYYLGRAADGAAQKASGEAKKLYETYRDEARKRLVAEYPNSRWAK